MNLLRVSQYIKRFIHVYVFAVFGTHQQRKINILTELYHYTVDFLNELDEEYWMDFGTLLGYYREGSIIPHDIDADFGMHEKSYQKVIESKHLLSPKVKFYDSSSSHHGPKLYLNYKGFDVDLYFYEDLGDTIRSYEKTSWLSERQQIPKSLVYPLQLVHFIERSSLVPAQPKGYLEFIYGYLGKDSKRNSETGFWEKV